MNRKIIGILLSFALILSSFSVLADSAELMQVVIKVNTETGTVTVGDETVDCEKPYITDGGTAMIDLNILTDAFGAQTEHTGNTFKITYGGAIMELAAGSDSFTINGNITLTMPENAAEVNGAVIVPLRFTAENMGADVAYDGETHSVIITGTPGSMNAEADLSAILRYTDKPRVGNSIEGWSFAKPRDFDIYSTPWSSGNDFLADDIEFTLSTYQNTEKLTTEKLLISMNAQSDDRIYFSSSVVFERQQTKRAGLDFVCTKIRRSDEIEQYAAFVTEDKIYAFAFSYPFSYDTFAQERTNPTVEAILDSFKIDYDGTDENTIDLTKIKSEENKESYEEPNYRWSISTPEKWSVSSLYGFRNTAVIYRQSDLNDNLASVSSLFGNYPNYSNKRVTPASLEVTIYSNPENKSLTAWSSEKRDANRLYYNDKYCTLTDISDTKVNELSAKTFTRTMEYDGNTQIAVYYFINNDKYRYMLVLTYDKRDGEQQGFLETANKMIQSFKPGDINYEDLGDAFEPYSFLETDKVTKNVKSDFAEVTVPYLWGSAATNNSNIKVYDSQTLMQIDIKKIYKDKINDDGILSYRTAEQTARDMLIDAQKDNPRNTEVIMPITETKLGAYNAYQFEYNYSYETRDGGKQHYNVIVADYNDTDCVAVILSYDDLYKGAADNVFADILNSVKIK